MLVPHMSHKGKQRVGTPLYDHRGPEGFVTLHLKAHDACIHERVLTAAARHELPIKEAVL
jgi:hypothetical protein